MPMKKPKIDGGQAVQADVELWRLLRMGARLLFRVRTAELAPLGISVRQAAMLSGIKELGKKATPASIARWQYRDPSSVSDILIRMERMGLVLRGGDPRNGRKVRVTLTAKGEELYRRSQEYGKVEQVFALLSAEERATFVAGLTKMRGVARALLLSEKPVGHGRGTRVD
jgi:DNA-binding MarR family transcriptional regulator